MVVVADKGTWRVRDCDQLVDWLVGGLSLGKRYVPYATNPATVLAFNVVSPYLRQTVAFRLACDYRSRGCLIGAPLVELSWCQIHHPVLVPDQPRTLRMRYFHMAGMRYPPCIDTAGKGKVRKRMLHGCCRNSRVPGLWNISRCSIDAAHHTVPTCQGSFNRQF